MGLTKLQGRQWERSWGRVVSRQDTGVAKVNNVLQNQQTQGNTLTALIQPARSTGVMALHSFRTFGVRQSPSAVAEANKRVETNKA